MKRLDHLHGITLLEGLGLKPSCRFSAYVYVIATSSNGPCKVGYSTCPEKRLKLLQAGNPHYLEIFCQVKSDWSHCIEREAHRLLRADRMHREWFDVSVDVARGAVSKAEQLCEDPAIRKERMSRYDWMTLYLRGVDVDLEAVRSVPGNPSLLESVVRRRS